MDNKDEPKDSAVNRRAFIAGAATGAAVVLAQQATVASAQEKAKPVIEPGVRVEPVRAPSLRTQFTADDLDVREFGPRASRRVLHRRAA